MPALGRPDRAAGVVLRAVADGPLRRGLFVAVRESDRIRPATATVLEAIRAIRATEAADAWHPPADGALDGPSGP